MRAAFFGGIYNNFLALEVAIRDARARGVDEMFCLGDLGAFGPHPDRVFPLLIENNVRCIAGNYDISIANELDDCRCGYTDPRDNYFAAISYEYTLAETSDAGKAWLRELPTELRFTAGNKKILLCHGSPRRTNEFLWESTTSTAFLNHLASEFDADILLGTHTGIHWNRELAGNRRWINVGVLGRPENDGTTRVWYTLLTVSENDIAIEHVPIEYEFSRLADEMRAEKIPAEFIQTIETGWWTTCLEVLPQKERRRGRF